MKVLKIFVCSLLSLPLIACVVIIFDYLIQISHCSSRNGFTEITTIELPDSIHIVDYKMESFFSMVDRPNHWWLLESDVGFAEVELKTSGFVLGGAKYIQTFGDAWPSLENRFRGIKVKDVTMGIGTGQETIFISMDSRFALVNAFRH